MIPGAIIRTSALPAASTGPLRLRARAAAHILFQRNTAHLPTAAATVIHTRYSFAARSAERRIIKFPHGRSVMSKTRISEMSVITVRTTRVPASPRNGMRTTLVTICPIRPPYPPKTSEATTTTAPSNPQTVSSRKRGFFLRPRMRSSPQVQNIRDTTSTPKPILLLANHSAWLSRFDSGFQLPTC